MSAPATPEVSGGRSSRNRRRTVKSVDYSKEQQFSDDDVFEDDLNKESTPTPVASVRKRVGRPRKSDAADDLAMEDFGYSPIAPRYTEKGYDPNLLPIRERYTFSPEYEADGSPKIECIVGRRPVVDKNKKRDSIKSQQTMKHIEYEYLVKYKGKSYLHLDWKTASDLESMNKSAKTLYRRFLKKIDSGLAAEDSSIEDPTFDPSYAQPQKIVDEKDQDVFVEMTDRELVEWEKAKEREAKEFEAAQMEVAGKEEVEDENITEIEKKSYEPSTKAGEKSQERDEEKKIPDDTGQLPLSAPYTTDTLALKIQKIRSILNKDGPYYPTFPGCDNPYRDGYITTPPKKPRASYLFFQCTHRSEYQSRYAGASQGEIMTILGDTWRSMSDEEQQPYLILAKEEVEHYEKERQLMEKAQKPNEIWQPLRRCKMVLERLWSDGFSTIFHEPVDTTLFPDYEDFVDSPMDLGQIKRKLERKKYQAPEIFARDVRKVWQNCKVYNQHGSAIWHVADYMSKQFERLYHAWVLAFRERYLRWNNPKARPWETSCRKCDGKCGGRDDDIVLCDFCDAMYGLECEKLTKVPDGIWHCPDCVKAMKETKIRMFSAVAEQAARKRAELGDVPKKIIKRRVYLVKWAGLGYEHCTWETRDDINDDKLIEEYQILNNRKAEEPDLMESDLTPALQDFELGSGNAKGLTEEKLMIEAQVRAFHFLKFGCEIPNLLSKECGSYTFAMCSKSTQHPKEVLYSITRICQHISRNDTAQNLSPPSCMPRLLAGEYDTVIPITAKGLMMNVGEVHGSVAFLGYRQFSDGSAGPCEAANIINNVGDKIIAVDGRTTVKKTFKDVISMLKESGKNQYTFMRFWSNKYSVCPAELSSMGEIGRWITEEYRKKLILERRRVIHFRKENKNDEKEETKEESEDEEEREAKGESDDEEDGSEGEFEPDSEDDDLMIQMKVKEALEKQKLHKDITLDNQEETEGNSVSKVTTESVKLNTITSEGKIDNITPTISTSSSFTPIAPEHISLSENKPKNDIAQSQQPIPLKSESPSIATDDSKTPTTPDPGISTPIPIETTRSLSLRLLNIDVGYSSDESGEEDHAYFMDGVDRTFLSCKKPLSSDKESSIPVKKNEFSTLGPRAKLCIATVLTQSQAPDPEDFDNYPNLSSKALALKEKKEQEALKASKQNVLQDKIKKSTTKVEQLSSTTNEIIRIWATAEEAAATLQIPLKEIKQILKGDDYNEELGDEAGGFRWRFADEDAEVTGGTENAKTSGSSGRDVKKSKQAYLEFRDKLYSHSNPHNYKGNHKLRDYQVDGVNWLASCWYKRHSCILADEMGLGKTVQIVTYIEHLHRVEKIQRPFLVVVPLSTVEHWRREFEGWTDMQCCVYHDRQREWRDVMREYEWYYADRPHIPEYLKFDVLVTTYDTLIGDYDVIADIPWRVTVVDEAHRLRNVKGKLLECMKQISARGTLQYGFQSRVLMTGTPLQNNTQELWTLLNFIEPYKFPSMEDFEENFGNMANREQVEALQRKISPFMLRRVKEDVAKDIPAKEETLIDVELTSIQKQYYRAVFEHNHAFLSMGSTRATAPKLMNIQMELRKCCNHPFLLDGVEQREMERCHKELLEDDKFNTKGAEEQQLMLNEHGYIKSSGKMVLLDKLLPKLRQEGHKVLIFSQMVRMLDLISEFCDFRGFRHERLDGRVRGNERQKAIDRFETEDDSFVFLLSTRAGGVGINLTAADICIIFDSDWNPQNDVQAQARCHRIGQTKDVMIYRLITSRSFEQEMFDRASKKLGLEQAVLGTFGQDNDDGKPTNKEMEQLLKKGAYALLEDENDETGKAFCEDDIESILNNRTRTRVVEGAKTASWLNKKGMVVSKSKFTGDSAAATANVDVDDPLFWQKVMPDFVTPTIMMGKLKEMCKLSDKSHIGADGEVGGGRGSRKKKPSAKKMDVTDENETFEEEEIGKSIKIGKGNKTRHDEKVQQPSRTLQKKANKFIADLTSMMENLLQEKEDDNLPQSEKHICQTLLLTVSGKESIFTFEQRNLAKIMLKKLEGDRRRKCTTARDESSRFSSIADEETNHKENSIPEALMIRSKKTNRRRRKKKGVDIIDDEKAIGTVRVKRKRGRAQSSSIGNERFIQHTDSEGDWSDVGDGLYKSKKRRGISRKEARRRRAWACDKDPATAAGRPWPVFPRNIVAQILGTMLDEVIKNDKSKGGLFSVPVPRDVFPDYYEIVKQPMDYGTMKEKLAKGEYRSAQAMQKDFILVMQNCLKYNAPDSDIVKEARKQALSMPTLLKSSAMSHNLFLSEDGTILEVHSEGDDDEYEANDGGGGGGGKENASSKLSTGRRVPRKKRHNLPTKKNMTNLALSKKLDTLKQSSIMRNRIDAREISTSSPSKNTNSSRDITPNAVMPADQDRPDTPESGEIRESSDQSDKNGNNSDSSASSASVKKPRIRISLALNGSVAKKGTVSNIVDDKISKKKRRRSYDTDETEDDDKPESSDEDNVARRRKKRKDEKEKNNTSRSIIRRRKKKKKKDEQGDDHDRNHSQPVESVSSYSHTRKIPKKNERKVADPSDDASDKDQHMEIVTSEQNSQEKPSRRKRHVSRESTTKEDDAANEHMDIEKIKNERLSLDGSFPSARGHFTKRGPWKLPRSVREDKFYDVAKHTLVKMCRNDEYSIFADKVTDEEAPGYSSIIKKPMDFGTMRVKLEEGAYGEPPDALEALFNDFLLVMDNCALYNEDDSDVAKEAARVMALLPEAYAAACAAVSDKTKRKRKRKKKEV